ncbi:MAG: dITP/XTP pyrophosphatase [Spirochaetes bacterium]|nr:MAG: dITP/XTP pyrophosphatase [Spirochaetota bacterium]
MKILAATFNAHKIEELKALFPGHEIVAPFDLGIDAMEIEENGESYFANAMIKAKALHALARMPTLADDSGLSVKALDGRPGIHSARYGTLEEGKALSQGEKNDRLLREMKGAEDRACAFFCCLVLIYRDDAFLCVQETCPGLLAQEPRGRGGFGYDPLVFLPEFNLTVAELSPEKKNQVSHRGKAAKILSSLLDKLPL